MVWPRVHGVEGGQDQVAGFGRGQADLHGFPVAHFAHQNDLGRLAQGRSQATGEGVEVGPHFPAG